jgi:Predicted membrane protein
MIRAGPSAAATQNRILLFGFVFLAIAITFAVYTVVRERAGVESLAMGSLLWWFLLMVATTIFLPGATFIFHWSLLFSLIGIGWMLLSSQEKGTRSLLNFLVLSLCALPGIILMAPVIYQIFVGLTLKWSFLVIALMVLLFGLLVPQLPLIAAPFKWVVPEAAAVAAIVLLFVGALISPAPIERPTNQIYYALNVDTGKAIWASDLTQRDDRTAQFFGGAQTTGSLADFAYQRSSRQYTVNAAPVAQLPAPGVSVLEDTLVHGVRTLRMQVSSPRQAGKLSVYVDSDTEVLSASVDETPIDELRDHWGLQIEGLPQQGVQLQLQLKTSEPLKLRLVDQSYGLPPLNGVSNSQFPTLVPKPDVTMLVKSFSF